MRKIKFRAWDTEFKKMYYPKKGEYLVQRDDGFFGICYLELTANYYDSKWKIIWREGFLIQFVGLKDKNGKDIYEGDVLKYGDKKDGIIIQIVWNDLSDNGFKILRQKDKNVIHDIRIYRFDEQAEVMGNIYENPDLLEDGK